MLLDHLHVGVIAGLEADSQNLAALLLSTADFNGLVQSDGKGLFEQYVYAVLQSVDGRLLMRGVVGADAYAVQLFVVDELLVARIEANALYAELLHESFSLAGNQIGSRNDFNVGHLLVAQYMAFCDPASTDDTDLELTGSIDLLGLNIGGKLGHYLVSLLAHFQSPLFVWYCLFSLMLYTLISAPLHTDYSTLCTNMP